MESACKALLIQGGTYAEDNIKKGFPFGSHVHPPVPPTSSSVSSESEWG